MNITELKNVEGFAAFCEGLNLRHFSPRELLSKGQAHETPGHRGYGLNTDPPPERWPNVIPAITMADRMREHFGRPVVILSAYRSAAYNAAIGGASRSQHLKFTALDLSCPGITPQACFDWLCIQRERDVFRGGLGLYRSFIHVDGRGTNATWNNT
ncbi:D-Ala-D-Ala carboxypeptidase family metallohydrolase [Pseudovibrio ascidiaceicola]|uniref:D-Ala-D-Ala carboxypeptidase family metallohydrolase n=1 Tax=Pseudovibrio ascidiaceicola TaxID=285279 RepID=UPI00135CAA77|nr:D-Ala-D-Ala carboxypeptidase family metallohydrolase [Pseudovibrio ascidiaceicola]